MDTNQFEEFFDVYDCSGRPTGQIWPRKGKPLAAGCYSRCVIICIINDEGKMLIQQRTADKNYWQNMWDISAGGLCSAGETPQESAMREVKEELGLDIDLTGIRPNLTTTFSRGYTDTFIVRRNVDLNELTFQKEEVQAARFADKDEIISMIEKGIFINYRRSWLDFIWDLSDGEYMF